MPALASLNDTYRVRTSLRDIVERALRKIGALASGEVLPAAQLKDALRDFNGMVDSWNTEKLIIYCMTRNSFTMTAATNPHEIGPGVAAPGFDAPRPNRIEQGSAFLTGGSLGTTQDELDVWTMQEWERQYDSGLSGTPCALYYQPTFPLGNIWTDIKADAGYTLILHLEQMLSQVFLEGSPGDGTTTELSLPPGYEDALVYNLAIALAPDYGKDPPAAVIKMAVEAKASIKRLNHKPLYLQCDPALLPQGGYLLDIERGDL